MRVEYGRFSTRLGSKLSRVEKTRFPDYDRGLGGADGSSWAFVAWDGLTPAGYLLVDFDDRDVDVEVLDFAAREGTNAGLSLLRAFLDKARKNGWRRVRAALRKVTWDGAAILRRVQVEHEWSDDEYDHVVLTLPGGQAGA